MLTRFGLLLIWLLHWLPYGWQVHIGNGLGDLLWLLARPRRHIADTNLRLCFPEWDAAQRQQIARAHFRCTARALLDQGLLRWGSAAQLRRLVQIENPELYNHVLDQPIILLAPHFIGLDVGAARLRMDYPPSVTIYSRIRNAIIDRWMLQVRARFSPTILVSRHDGVRPLIKAMKQGHHLFYLPDQDFGARDALFIPFFGVPAATINALPRLAGLTHAKVMPVVTRQLPGAQGYVLRFYPAWDNFPGPDIASDLRRMNTFIESVVREMPEQYFWLHKRFKSRPAGEPSVYD